MSYCRVKLPGDDGDSSEIPHFTSGDNVPTLLGRGRGVSDGVGRQNMRYELSSVCGEEADAAAIL